MAYRQLGIDSFETSRHLYSDKPGSCPTRTTTSPLRIDFNNRHVNCKAYIVSNLESYLVKQSVGNQLWSAVVAYLIQLKRMSELGRRDGQPPRVVWLTFPVRTQPTGSKSLGYLHIALIHR